MTSWGLYHHCLNHTPPRATATATTTAATNNATPWCVGHVHAMGGDDVRSTVLCVRAHVCTRVCVRACVRVCVRVFDSRCFALPRTPQGSQGDQPHV